MGRIERCREVTLQSIPEQATLARPHTARHSEETAISHTTFDSEETLVEGGAMASNNGNVVTERRRSHGIGGAGNMRKYRSAVASPRD